MSKKLFIPGPCEVGEEVLEAMAQPTPRHYGDEWVAFYNDTLEALKQVFQTQNDLFIVPAAGSAALDMAFGSLLATGETVVVGDNGFFGERMGIIASYYGLRIVPFTAPIARPLDPEQLREILRQEPEAQAVAVVHHETATTVLNPLQELAEVTHEAGLPLIVDAVSSLGGVPLPVDEWGIDVCVSVANKCLECPPGLSLISVSERAWEWAERNEEEPHGWYLSLEPWRRYARDWGDWHPTPVTMPTNNILGLRKSLDMILSEGLESHFARYRGAARAVREGLGALGFEMVVEDEFASPIATAVHARLEESTPLEEPFDLREFMDYLATEHEIIISGGLDALKGKIFRVGHMGKASTRLYLIDFLLAVEDYVRRLGREIPVGTSLIGLMEAE